MAPTSWDGKPVQVYIMMGQSNMLGEGEILPPSPPKNVSLLEAVEDGEYPYLWNAAAKNWKVWPNLRNVFIMGSGNSTFNKSVLQHNEWMNPVAHAPKGNHKTLGPEYGIADFGGAFKQDNVMLLKSCIGDRALGWDLLPPGTARWNYADASGTTYTYAGYKDSPMKWDASKPKPAPMGWYAGEQWDGDTANAQVRGSFLLFASIVCSTVFFVCSIFFCLINLANAQYVLDHLSDFYPGATKYEIAGFFWWQGDKDSRDIGLSTRYEFNLVNLIKQVRSSFLLFASSILVAHLFFCLLLFLNPILPLRAAPPEVQGPERALRHREPWPDEDGQHGRRGVDPRRDAERGERDQVPGVQGQRRRRVLVPPHGDAVVKWWTLQPRRADVHERWPGDGRRDGQAEDPGERVNESATGVRHTRARMGAVIWIEESCLQCVPCVSRS